MNLLSQFNLRGAISFSTCLMLNCGCLYKYMGVEVLVDCNVMSEIDECILKDLGVFC